jgi:hypothetical protein
MTILIDDFLFSFDINERFYDNIKKYSNLTGNVCVTGELVPLSEAQNPKVTDVTFKPSLSRKSLVSGSSIIGIDSLLNFIGRWLIVTIDAH